MTGIKVKSKNIYIFIYSFLNVLTWMKPKQYVSSLSLGFSMQNKHSVITGRQYWLGDKYLTETNKERQWRLSCTNKTGVLIDSPEGKASSSSPLRRTHLVEVIDLRGVTNLLSRDVPLNMHRWTDEWAKLCREYFGFYMEQHLSLSIPPSLLFSHSCRGWQIKSAGSG